MKIKKIATNIIAIALSVITLSQGLPKNLIKANGDTASGAVEGSYILICIANIVEGI